MQCNGHYLELFLATFKTDDLKFLSMWNDLVTNDMNKFMQKCHDINLICTIVLSNENITTFHNMKQTCSLDSVPVTCNHGNKHGEGVGYGVESYDYNDI